MKIKTAVVIPNWNGEKYLTSCINSLSEQSQKCDIIVVENGSVDGSLKLLKNYFPNVIILAQDKNLGFAAGVNVGISYAIDNNYDFIGLFNNDAVAHKDWVKNLVDELEYNKKAGIVTCKLLKNDKKYIDSTGDLYTSWGLPFPRGRDELDNGQFNKKSEVFSASGGASIYRAEMLKQIGLFDDNFFAYYEDVDISFRGQLAGWKVIYQPKAEAYHQIGGTSSKVKDFTTYQTLKNLPMVYWKNVPLSIAATMWPKIFIAYWSIFFSALLKGKIKASLKGALMCHILMFKKLFIERPKIQKSKTVSDEYIKKLITPGLPPNAHKLKKLRGLFVRDS